MSEKVNRNQSCPCGSGKKYKKCCHQKKTFSLGAKNITVQPANLMSAAKISPTALRNIHNFNLPKERDETADLAPDRKIAKGELPDNAKVD